MIIITSIIVSKQGRLHEFSIGWAILGLAYCSYFEVEHTNCMRSMPNLGGLGACPPGNFFKIMSFESEFSGILPYV